MKKVITFNRNALEYARAEVVKKGEQACIQYRLETGLDFEESVRRLMGYKKKELAELIVNCYILEQSEVVKDYMRSRFSSYINNNGKTTGWKTNKGVKWAKWKHREEQG